MVYTVQPIENIDNLQLRSNFYIHFSFHFIILLLSPHHQIHNNQYAIVSQVPHIHTGRTEDEDLWGVYVHIVLGFEIQLVALGDFDGFVVLDHVVDGMLVA